VRFVGELRDKRAVCRHCGSQVDLPDTYRRVQRRHEQESQEPQPPEVQGNLSTKEVIRLAGGHIACHREHRGH
jgi:hypothetical protein